MANIALVDDHILLRNGLAGLITELGHKVLFEADNGRDMLHKLSALALPDIVLLDINMPEMDGYETARHLKENYPEVMILALSMYDNEQAIISMIKAGAKGYILKDSDPHQLQSALNDLMSKGFYYSDLVSGKLFHAINHNSIANPVSVMSEREIDFLKHACSELTYKEISDKMFVSPRTVDGYRDSLFDKLQVRTRVGLVIYAIRNGLVDIS